MRARWRPARVCAQAIVDVLEHAAHGQPHLGLFWTVWKLLQSLANLAVGVAGAAGAVWPRLQLARLATSASEVSRHGHRRRRCMAVVAWRSPHS